MPLETRTPTQPIYRVARYPDAWQLPDWSRAKDGTFGNRFDDPESEYRVLYASSQQVSCFVETLARFRPDLTLIEELKAIAGEDDFLPIGEVPLNWCSNRVIGTASAEGKLCRHLRRGVDCAACGASWRPNVCGWAFLTSMRPRCRVRRRAR